MTSIVSKITETRFPTTEFLLNIEEYEYGNFQKTDSIPQLSSSKATLFCVGESDYIFLKAIKKGPEYLHLIVNDIYNSNDPEFTWSITRFENHFMISNNYFNQYLASINGKVKLVPSSTSILSKKALDYLLWNFKKNQNPTYQIQNKKDELFLSATTKNQLVTMNTKPNSWYIKIQ